jgi:hypothetical protein
MNTTLVGTKNKKLVGFRSRTINMELAALVAKNGIVVFAIHLVTPLGDDVIASNVILAHD